MLPWRDINEKLSQPALGNQVSCVTSCGIQECQSPGCKNDDNKTFKDDAVSCNSDDPQEDVTI
jgi:hypothetical protein